MVFEECLQCKESIPLLKLRKHIQACTQSLSSDVSVMNNLLCKESYLDKSIGFGKSSYVLWIYLDIRILQMS